MQSEKPAKSPRRGTPWTTGEKWLLSVIIVALAGGIGIWAAFNSLEQMPDIKIPERVEPSPNGYTYFLSAADAAVEGGSALASLPRSQTSAHPEQWLTKPPSALALAADRRVAPQNAAALALLCQGLALPCLAPQQLSPTMPRPVAKLRHLARAVRDTSIAMATDGHVSQAMDTATDGLALGERMIQGGDMIDMIVGKACQALGRRAIWPMVSHADVKSARLTAQRILAIDSHAASFGEILEADKWTTLSSILPTLGKPTWRADLLSNYGANGEADPAQARALSFVSKRALVNAYIKRVDQTIAITKGPFQAGVKAPNSGIQFVDDSLMMLVESDWYLWCLNSVNNRLLATTLALRAYRLDHGSYPATLAALVPEYLPAIPQDQFSGTVLKYKLAGGVYTLYSVGPDGKDNGGKAIGTDYKGDSRYHVRWSSRGDIVAGLNE